MMPISMRKAKELSVGEREELPRRIEQDARDKEARYGDAPKL